MESQKGIVYKEAMFTDWSLLMSKFWKTSELWHESNAVQDQITIWSAMMNFIASDMCNIAIYLFPTSHVKVFASFLSQMKMSDHTGQKNIW